MGKIDGLLKWVQKTNPEMTEGKLIKELLQCRYSTIGLVMAYQSSEKQAV